MYQNYGDRNFFEHGRLAEAGQDSGEIRVLYCEPFADEEDLYLFADCTVDLSDDWVDWKRVCEYAGLEKEAEENTEKEDGKGNGEENKEEYRTLLAIAAIDYYGVENFSSPYDGYRFPKEKVKEKLKYYEIESDVEAN